MHSIFIYLLLRHMTAQDTNTITIIKRI